MKRAFFVYIILFFVTLPLLFPLTAWSKLNLHVAAKHGNVGQVKKILTQNVDVNSLSSSGYTPLHISAGYDMRRVAGLLVAHGAEINIQNISGWTPLHLAAGRGHIKMAQFLLSQGANPEIQDRAGRTPIDLAMHEFNEDMVVLLESASNDVMVINKNFSRTRQQNDWVVIIGGGGLVGPEYSGGNRIRVDFYPHVDISWRDYVFINIGNGFESSNINNGIGAHIFKTQNFIFGTSLNYYESRDEDDSGKLKGFGDIEPGAEFQIFTEYWLGELSFLNKLKGTVSLFSKLQHDITGSHGGWVLTGGMRHKVPLNKNIELKMDYKVSWANEDYMGAYYDVYQNQAATTTIVAYDAGAGIKDIALGMGIIYSFKDSHWVLKAKLEYTRLLGDAQDSPLVDPDGGQGNDNQLQLGTALAYSF